MQDPPRWEIESVKEIVFEREEDAFGDKVKKELGSGSFGRVYAGTFRGHLVAIKQLPIVDAAGILAFRREAGITFRLQHVNVAKCVGGFIRDRHLRKLITVLFHSLCSKRINCYFRKTTVC